MAETAVASGVSVLEGFHYYFHPVTQRAFALAEDGTLGTITRVEVRMAMPPPGEADPRWSYELAGGALMDLGCYGIHILRMLGEFDVAGLGGAPDVVRAEAEQRTADVDAWCDVEFAFPGGATALSTNSMVGEDYSFTIRIVGTDGEAFVHDFIGPNRDDRLTLTTSAGVTEEHLGTRSSYSYQLEAFAAHVEHGSPLPFGPDDAVANMTLIDAAYRAAGMNPR